MSQRLQVAVHCAIDARNTTGESPLWSAREAALDFMLEPGVAGAPAAYYQG